MGNMVSASVSSGGGGKIVLPDGSVRALGLGEPVSVAELMVEHPRHFVVDARLLAATTTTGGGGGAKKVAALPADPVLVGAGVYVVLPATRCRVVSADEARGRAPLAASRPLAQSRSMPADAREQRDKAAARLGGLGEHRPGAVVQGVMEAKLEDDRRGRCLTGSSEFLTPIQLAQMYGFVWEALD